MKPFSPMLAPNQKTDLSTVKYSLFASYKLDGIRCIFKEGEILSRSLKNIVNKQLREKFKPLADYSKEQGIILDGEIYCNEIPFSMISSCVMTQDVYDKKAVKKWSELCEDYDIEVSREDAMKHLCFYIFDAVKPEKLEEPFSERLIKCSDVGIKFESLVKVVLQEIVHGKDRVEGYFESALEEGYEGLILKDMNGRYKCGRGTVKEGLIYKVKPFESVDAVIKGVKQGTKVDPNAEKKVNELGRSVTSKKLGDRILVDRVSDFYVDYEGKELKVSCSSMTHKDREKYWKIRETLVGKTIEYKYMLVGSKDLPRHPGFVRFREDKD